MEAIGDSVGADSVPAIGIKSSVPVVSSEPITKRRFRTPGLMLLTFGTLGAE
jgi:hypothetical protein